MKKILSLLLAGLAAASMAAVVSADEPVAGADYIECVGGVKVWEWVEGFTGETPDKLFDYNETTKWCHASSWSYVVWEMPSAVEITGYQLVTANDNATYPDRNPTVWTLFGCNDYDWTAQDGSWEEIHLVDNDVEIPDTNYTPFLIDLGKTAPAYKYFMWEINEIESSGTFQMSGLNLIFDGQAAQEVKTEEEILAEKAAADAAANAAHIAELVASGSYVEAKRLAPIDGIVLVSGTPGYSDAEGPVSLFDYNTSTKWCSSMTTHGEGNPWEVIWEMPNAVAITGYQLITGGDTATNATRNPVDFTLSGSADGSTWTEIDVKTGDTTMLAENNLAFDFMLASTAPEYKFFKFVISATGGDQMQLSGINLIFEGAEATGEEAPGVAVPVAPETEAPETEAPETEAPETEAPETEAPETEAPETEAPETEAPETEAPAAEAPETEAPAAEAPETEAPAAEAPAAEGGCGSFIGGGMIVIMAILGTAWISKRK